MGFHHEKFKTTVEIFLNKLEVVQLKWIRNANAYAAFLLNCFEFISTDIK